MLFRYLVTETSNQSCHDVLLHAGADLRLYPPTLPNRTSTSTNNGQKLTTPLLAFRFAAPAPVNTSNRIPLLSP
jgi:hypothetical protein